MTEPVRGIGMIEVAIFTVGVIAGGIGVAKWIRTDDHTVPEFSEFLAATTGKYDEYIKDLKQPNKKFDFSKIAAELSDIDKKIALFDSQFAALGSVRDKFNTKDASFRQIFAELVQQEYKLPSTSGKEKGPAIKV